jgi:serine/threonine protein kinase
MALNIASQAELIPGYRLLERLGQGGFGEVWKAEAPGGLLKAVKILHGSLEGSADGPCQVQQELKALNRVRTVRHPFILSLERFEIVEGRLVIVMELADKSLHDRVQEYRAQGLPGIARDELLRYMEETAEALDLMNGQFNLQHLDIKPQNLFLLFNHIKVGDFGLVKDLEGMWAKATSGVTAIYAAPETFEGVISRFCDQYNLAIAYQELLTGQLPFDGTTARQLMMQHLTGVPNVQPLPPGDQAVVARALAKKPEERFSSCMDFVLALREAGELASVAQCGRRGSPTVSDEQVKDRAEAATPMTLILRRPSKDDPPTADCLKVDTSSQGHLSKTAPSAAPVPEKSPGPRSSDSTPSSPRPVTPPPAPERPETTGEGVLLPSLIVGLGGLGREVLQELRKSLLKRGGPSETWQHIRLLHLDTDPQALEQATSGDPNTVLSPDEILLTLFHRPSYYLKRPRERQQLQEWLPLTPLANVPRDQVTARGCRALGRLAYVSSAATVAARLRDELEACVGPEALNATARRTGLGLRSTWPRVYVVTGLTGGTGSGMFLDLAYALRRTLGQLGYPRAEVIGLLLLPANERSAPSARAVANAYAALAELNYFASRGRGEGDKACVQGPPFSRCVLLPLPAKGDGAAGIQELAGLAGDYLCRNLTTPLGRVADQSRGNLQLPAAPMPCQTFAAYWFSVPRRPLLQRGAQSICDRMVRSWQVNDQAALDAVIQAWVADLLTRSGLSHECLETRLQEASADVLGQTLPDFCGAVVQNWAEGGPADLRRRPAGVEEALAELEHLLGKPQQAVAMDLPSPPMQALGQASRSLAADAEKELAEIALGALGEPQFRLTGSEDAVQRQLWTALGEAARLRKCRSEQQCQQARDIHQKTQPLFEILQRGMFLRWGAKQRAAAEIIEHFRAYLTARWESALSQAVGRLCLDLQSNLHRYQRTVACCRGRIGQFLKSFADSSTGEGVEVDLGLGRYLLPAGCRTLAEAVARLLDRLTPAEELALHQKVQALIRQTLQAHVHVCTAPVALFKDLKEAIDREVETLAEISLGRAHAAELYLEQHAEDPAVYADLTAAFDEAQPELAGSRQAGRQELCILAVPPGPEGERFRALVDRALPDTPMHAAASTSDIVFYREHVQVILTELPQLGPAAHAVYQQALTTEAFGVHSRHDIVAWLPAGVARNGYIRGKPASTLPGSGEGHGSNSQGETGS